MITSRLFYGHIFHEARSWHRVYHPSDHPNGGFVTGACNGLMVAASGCIHKATLSFLSSDVYAKFIQSNSNHTQIPLIRCLHKIPINSLPNTYTDFLTLITSDIAHFNLSNSRSLQIFDHIFNSNCFKKHPILPDFSNSYISSRQSDSVPPWLHTFPFPFLSRHIYLPKFPISTASLLVPIPRSNPPSIISESGPQAWPRSVSCFRPALPDLVRHVCLLIDRLNTPLVFYPATILNTITHFASMSYSILLPARVVVCVGARTCRLHSLDGSSRELFWFLIISRRRSC